MPRRLKVETVFSGVDRVSAPIRRMQARVKRFTRSAARGMRKVRNVTRSMVSGIKRGAQVMAGAMVAVGFAIARVGRIGVQFEQTMVNAAAKFPGQIKQGTKAFEELEQAALRVGKTTEFTASDSAGALNFLAMAGFDAKQSIAALPGVVDLATVAQMDLAEATGVAADILGAFNLRTKDSVQLSANMARVNDALAHTSTSANTTVSEMYEAISAGGPVANAAGASIETVSALLASMANAGIKGSNAGTTLKNMFLRLAGPIARGAKALKKYGVATKDSKGDMRDITDILEDLNKELGTMGTGDRAAVLKDVFGRIPIAGVNVLLATGAEKLREFRTETENATGASNEMAATMRDTTLGALKELWSVIEGIVIEVFKLGGDKGLKGLIRKMTEWVRENEKFILSGIKEFLGDIVDNWETIVFWVGKLAKSAALIMGVSAAVEILSVAMTVLNTIMMMNPVILIITLIAGAIALLIVFSDDIGELFKTTWDDVSEYWEVGVNQLTQNGPISWLLAAVALIQDRWAQVAPWFQSMLADVYAYFAESINKLVNTGPVQTLIGVGKKVEEAFAPLRDFFRELWADIAGIFQGAATSISGFGASITGWVSGIIKKKDALSGRFHIEDAFDRKRKEVVHEAAQRSMGARSENIDEIMNPTSDSAQMIPPEERIRQVLNRSEQKSSAEVTIKDETGRAQVSKGQLGGNIKLQNTGSF